MNIQTSTNTIPFLKDILTQEEKNTLLNSNLEIADDSLVTLYKKIEKYLVSTALDLGTDQQKVPTLIKDHFKTFLNYNMFSGKRFRALILLRVGLKLSQKLTPKQSPVESKEEQIKYLSIVFLSAFLIELLQAIALVADDIMDSSKVRRGKTCWYLNKNIGLIAVNDVLWGFSLINLFYNKFIKDPELSSLLFNEMNELKIKLGCGQALDTIVPNYPIKENENLYSANNYEKIVFYKTTLYTIHYPVLFPYLTYCHFERKQNELEVEGFKSELEQFTKEIGLIFQVQDDYLDVFGDYKVMGKVGSDIEEGKCTWLIVKCLEKLNGVKFCIENSEECVGKKEGGVCRHNKEYKEMLVDNIGRKEESTIRKVKGIMEKCNLREDYREWISVKLKNLETTNYMPNNKFVVELLNKFVEKIKNREK